MGTCGSTTFEDDGAADWVWELKESSDLSVVRAALEAVDRNSGYLEAPECCAGLAAGEVVAALCGRPGANLPDEVWSWVAVHSTLQASALKPLASRVVQRILERSELRELWEESEEFAAWSANVTDLARRVA